MPVFLENIRVEFISLVRKGANKKQVIWKTADGEPPQLREIPIVKTDDEKRLLYGIVYSPDEVDSQGDYTDAAQIEKAAHAFMRAGMVGNIDKDHSFEPEDGAFVAESWIVKDGDPVFPEEKEGAWAVAVKIEDDDLWGAVKKGDIGGLSMGGVADKIKKASDFKAVQTVDDMWRFFNPLECSIRSILEDEAVPDKKAAISDTIEQFKSAVVDNVSKSQGDGLLTKIKRLFKQQETDMDEKQVKDIATAAVTEAIEKMEKPLAKEDMKAVVVGAVKEIVGPIEKRLEAIEKSSPGTAQQETDLGGDGADLEALGAEIAKAYMEG